MLKLLVAFIAALELAQCASFPDIPKPKCVNGRKKAYLTFEDFKNYDEIPKGYTVVDHFANMFVTNGQYNLPKGYDFPSGTKGLYLGMPQGILRQDLLESPPLTLEQFDASCTACIGGLKCFNEAYVPAPVDCTIMLGGYDFNYEEAGSPPFHNVALEYRASETSNATGIFKTFKPKLYGQTIEFQVLYKPLGIAKYQETVLQLDNLVVSVPC